jgi:TrpR family trp operon transcriptional repressor
MESDVHELAKVFARITTVRTMRKFFNEIFTETERNDLALRWRLMKMLKKNISQRDIASRLGISLCKITRGAKILKDKKSVTNKIIDNR